MNKSFATLLIIALAISPFVFFLMSWQLIPETVIFKIELGRQFDKIQTKNELLIGCAALSIASMICYLLLSRLHKIDPKLKDQAPQSVFNKLGLVLAVFLTAINFYLVLTARNEWSSNMSIMFVFIGLLITIIGNYMHSIRPNYFAGLRLPWTLNNADNWRKTHQFASKIWFVAGLLIICMVFLLSEKMLLPAFIAIMVIIVVVPGIYSFQLYRRENRIQGSE